ncbi:isocitrate lyase/PEP mutase family protein [Pollutimonas bauzanensis]|uniref:2-Methylisocitrate lyase, PEP mutase family n=1 Tax=Pollutimonas bauzanensis TaxID=658167 RepID=A0A1M5YGI9_9BURK|nr:isocitrate lyase/phosphoenolpyruvate mutase family protein [Pollutimonas bauzanensis]SHI11019.1 2-Methylisocitrate lyase, PEP mutase family [Pollutimonas bauzanensis]
MKTLKSTLESVPYLLAPGVYDSFSALIAEQAGFDAVYLSGASIAYTRLGRSDVGLTTYTEVEQTLSRIADRVRIPIIVDADTGFGNALNVIRTVKGFEKAGASMIQMEDQTFPKRCGHLDGKSVVPVAEMCGKLKAAVDARRHDTTLILARSDALAVEGFDAALDRAEAYLECGADVLFIEALRTDEEMARACERFKGRAPLLANMVEGGMTPIQSASALADIGFKIVIFPGGAARAVAHSLQSYYGLLRKNGSTAASAGAMLDFRQLNELIETPALLELGARYQ